MEQAEQLYPHHETWGRKHVLVWVKIITSDCFLYEFSITFPKFFGWRTMQDTWHLSGWVSVIIKTESLSLCWCWLKTKPQTLLIFFKLSKEEAGYDNAEGQEQDGMLKLYSHQSLQATQCSVSTAEYCGSVRAACQSFIHFNVLINWNDKCALSSNKPTLRKSSNKITNTSTDRELTLWVCV